MEHKFVPLEFVGYSPEEMTELPRASYEEMKPPAIAWGAPAGEKTGSYSRRQFSTFNDSTCLNSRSLSVTTTRPSDSA